MNTLVVWTHIDTLKVSKYNSDSVHSGMLMLLCTGLEKVSLLSETQLHRAPSLSGYEVCPLKTPLHSQSCKVLVKLNN